MSDLNQLTITLYSSGKSVGEVAEAVGIPKSSARRIISAAGVMRTRSEGLRLVNLNGGGSAKLKGKKRTYAPEMHQRIVAAAVQRRREKAKGVRVNANGYYEFTMGPHYGRNVHVVKMEERLGRKLKADECVHHIDGDKLNNDDNNLALLTVSGHARLHRIQDAIRGYQRERKSNGCFA